MMLIGDDGEHNIADSGELLRRETVKFSWLRLPLDAPLHRDDPGDEVLPPDYLLLHGMVSIHGSMTNFGELHSVVCGNTKRERLEDWEGRRRLDTVR
jgi:hypothetical protein